MNNSNRNEYVDIVRGIGILSIVVGHAFNTDNIWNSAVDGVRKFVYIYIIWLFSFGVQDICSS